MSSAWFHFHAELNDFLPAARRDASFAHALRGPRSVKDLAESLGVPHPEIEAILVNGEPQDFSYLLQDGDRIELYPISLAASIGPYRPLRPPVAADPGFVLDTHLGQLATYLRMLGFDTLYRNDYPDDLLARISSAEGRILLTRDRGLLKRGMVVHGYYVRATNPRLQVIELLRRYKLAGGIAPLRRCSRCNGLLQAVPKAEVAERLKQKTRDYYDDFSICLGCGQIYWKGSHYERIQQFIADLLAELGRD
jgi:uncharacterized protein with PIN domain